MPCNPIADSNFHPPAPPFNFSGLNGFAVQFPDLNIPFPDLPLDDLLALFDQLGMLLPPGLLKPNLDADILNKPMAAFLSLISQLMPFLMIYKFFLPVLNLILCIIEVLCAIANPFKLARAIRRLFRQCLPEFLALFPFFAIILMIIALILLIIALIEYLIERIIELIEMIIANIKILAMAARRLDNDSIIAITKKIGDLLCLLQNLFVILGVIALIIQLMKAMLNLTFNIPPCDSSNGTSDGCCSTDVCPDFIKNNQTLTSNTGFFQYFPEIGIDSGLVLPANFPQIISVIRNESWQFYDPNLPYNKSFINITKAYDLPQGNNTVFFPPGASYNNKTNPSSTPYTVDFRVFYDPSAFGKTDPKGARYIKISKAIVQSPPTAGVLSYDGKTYVSPVNGTLNLIGGSIQEDDETPILDSNGNTIPLDVFFHKNASGGTPSSTDGVLFSDVSYTFNINYEILVGASLITVGCMPEVALDRDFINNTIGSQFNANALALSSLINSFPDADAAQQCIMDNINTFRQSISVESATTLQANLLSCLGKLQSDSLNTLNGAINAGFDQYKSNFSIDPIIQFTTLPITVSVNLNESSGNNICNNLPSSAASEIASNISAEITFGDVSKFVYDGYSSFNAYITSKDPGNGKIKIKYNNQYFSTLTNPSSIDQNPTVSITELDYTFVQSSVISSADGTGEPRRDISDVSGDMGGM